MQNIFSFFGIGAEFFFYYGGIAGHGAYLFQISHFIIKFFAGQFFSVSEHFLIHGVIVRNDADAILFNIILGQVAVAFSRNHKLSHLGNSFVHFIDK